MATAHAKHHDYHLVDPSPWPAVGAASAFLLAVGAISVAPFAQKVGYDPVQDLAPVGIISSIVQAVIVKKDLPVKWTAQENVAWKLPLPDRSGSTSFTLAPGQSGSDARSP